MTNEPKNKTIEQIRKELNPYLLRSDVYGQVWNDGFDARGKIEEERTKKLVEALEKIPNHHHDMNCASIDTGFAIDCECWIGDLRLALQEFKGEK